MESIGLAASTVVLSEQIRPWYNAGLRFLFDEDGSIAQAMVDAKTTPQVVSQPVSIDPRVGQYSHGAMTSTQSQQPAPQSHSTYAVNPQQSPNISLPDQKLVQQQSAPQSNRNQQEDTRPSAAQSQGSSQQISQSAVQARRPAQAVTKRAVPPRQSPSLVIHPTNKPPEEWPDQWQGYWAKVQIPSPVVWTYWALGDDLSGHADPRRREVLKKLIGSLNLPRGTSSFWPVAASGQNSEELTPAPEIFLAGLRRLRPRYSVVFGSKALKSFMPESTLRPYLFTQFLGHRLIALPDVDYLVKSPNILAPVVAYLRTTIKLTR